PTPGVESAHLRTVALYATRRPGLGGGGDSASGGGVVFALEVALADVAARERELHQPGTLLVLGEPRDPELPKQHAEMGLDGIDRKRKLFGDLSVGGGKRVHPAAAVRSAERDQHPF